MEEQQSCGGLILPSFMNSDLLHFPQGSWPQFIQSNCQVGAAAAEVGAWMRQLGLG